MDVNWADNEDKKGFVDFVLAAGGGIDNSIENFEIVSIEGYTLDVSCDRVEIGMVVTYDMNGTLGKAATTVVITVDNRTVGCST